MITERNARIDRAVLALVSAWVLACAVLIIVNFVRSPMSQRRARLNDRLANIAFVDERFDAAADSDYLQLRERILNKNALWTDLVAPPPPAPAVQRGPKLDELVKGIHVSAREQLRTASGVKVKVRTEGDNVGRWRGMGDKVNELVITEITPEKVVFTATIGNKEYQIPVERK